MIRMASAIKQLFLFGIVSAGLIIISSTIGCIESGPSPAQKKRSASTARKRALEITPPIGGPIVYQPYFVWQGGEETAQGTGFFVRSPDGHLLGITSSHFLDFDGPAMLSSHWLSVDESEFHPVASFYFTYGKPGPVSQQGSPSKDYMIFLAEEESQITNTKSDELSTLELDTRAEGPEIGEVVWLPNKNPNKSIGYSIVTGTVTGVTKTQIKVELDRTIKLQSQSGSPFISAKTGKVIGTLSTAMHLRDSLQLFLCPANSIDNEIQSAVKTYPTREIIGVSQE